jgi:hypothetical protein
VSVSPNARVEGAHVHGEGPAAILVYNRVPPGVSSEDDYVDLPRALFMGLSEVAYHIVLNDMEAADKAAQTFSNRFSQRREYGEIPDPTAFP